MTISGFSFPTAIRFGPGARREVAGHLQSQGLQRPLIVTDRGLAELPVLAEFRSLLGGLEPAVYAGVAGNPTASQVTAGAQAFRAHGADCVIGFGGGAALDVAKVVGLAATHEGTILEYAWDHPRVRAIERELPYFVALPTTAGTGSEVGRSAVISEDDTHLKRIVFSPKILARAVFADPELTLGAAAARHRRHRHGRAHPQHRKLALALVPPAVRRHRAGRRPHRRALAAARRCASRDDIAARSDMMMASMMGAIAFQKDLGAVHSCAHALGAVCHMHHGLANALMIDTVLEWNQQAVPAKFEELAHVCGVSGGGEQFIPWLRALKARIGIQGKLAGHGVALEDIPKLVDIALADGCHQTNPRPCTRDDFRAFFEAAM